MLSLLVLACLASASFGKPQVTQGTKIVGGTDVNIEKYPHQLSMELFGGHVCGASIISEYWVLTAAHCAGASFATTTFRAGSSFIGVGGKVHGVTQRIVHEEFDDRVFDYDIALYRVSEPFRFWAGVAPINLPAQNEPVAIGAACDVTGWGAIEEGGTSSFHLQTVTVPLLSQYECMAAYKNDLITPRMMCAGMHAGGIDSCQGDSGGPLVWGGKLVGVVSWGYGCARPNLPGVYSRVASLRDWIKNNSGI